MRVNHEIPPFYDADSTILILGSMPSITSRAKGFYYMHPQNRFWPVLEAVYEETITDKKAFLTKHHIALWDVIESCEITSSSDASIKKVIPNDIKSLLAKTKITKIITVGTKATTLYQKYLLKDLQKESIPLPSTSSANAAWSKEALILAYRKILTER